MERRATHDRADADPQHVPLVARPTHEALAEVRAQASDVGLRRILRSGQCHWPWGIELEVRGTRFGDDRLSVEQEDAVVIGAHGERALERRRTTKRHLDVGAVDERGQSAACVTAVRGHERATKAALERDLHHRISTS